jgi:hypothetical protein
VKRGRRLSICLLAGWLLFVGSASADPPRRERDVETFSSGKVKVIRHFPTRSRPFGISKKLNPIWWIANADDPLPPPNYRQGRHCRKIFWNLRNPFHNFTFYVIGVADRPVWRAGPFPTQVTNPHGGWNWAVCRYGCVGLPFIDYRHGRFEGYFGWRTGGNFGLKLNFAQRKQAKAKPGQIIAGQNPG